MTKTKTKSTDDTINLAMPKRSVGAQSLKAKEEYEAALDRWCSGIIKMADERAAQPDNFDVSSRGWCYLIEDHGLFKDEFDSAQRLINDCRKSGRLPLDICCEDDRRAADNIEYIDNTTTEEEAEAILERLDDFIDDYHPFSFWEDQDYYLQMMVEKIDVKNLFAPICMPFRIPIFNAGGWCDLNARAAMMRRFKQWERRGKKCVLLTATDLDPGGIRIADTIRKNLMDLADQVGWKPNKLIIDRFAIDDDFIRENRVTWIDNLRTAKGKYPLDDPRHNDHHKAYVQDFLRKYGARKVEATVLVKPKLAPPARAMCRKAILQYVPASAVDVIGIGAPEASGRGATVAAEEGRSALMTLRLFSRPDGSTFVAIDHGSDLKTSDAIAATIKDDFVSTMLAAGLASSRGQLELLLADAQRRAEELIHQTLRGLRERIQTGTEENEG